MTLDAAHQQYVATWDTRRCLTGSCTLDITPRYRIRVLTGAGQAGSTDVRLVSGDPGRPGSPIDPGAVLTMHNGRTLDIRFWIAVAPAPAPSTATWHLLSTSAGVPANVTASTYVPSADAVYALIGAGDYTPFALWKFSLATSTWAPIATSNFPIGKYRKLVYDPATRSFLTYWDGLGQVYRVPEAGGAWTSVGNSPNSDQFYVGGAFINPLTGRLSQISGYGYFAFQNILWEHDGLTGLWAQGTQTGARPWPRIAPVVALDAAHAQLYLTEGQGNASGSQGAGVTIMDDVWRFDLGTRTWTNLVSLGTAPDNRQRVGLAYVPSPEALLRFGGYLNTARDGYGGIINPDQAQHLNTVVRLDLGAAPANWQRMTTHGTPPSARYDAGVFYDAVRNRLLVVGGKTATARVMDVWALDLQD